MRDRILFILSRFKERLWVRPLAMTLISVALVFLARTADYTGLRSFVPEITPDSIKTLLSIMSASMLVIATFSVASMVSAYASASSTATPRAFTLVISDDVSQNALSTFIGAFIYSVVGLIAIENSYYDKAGRFALFLATAAFFAIVVVTFVRWVDSIARLGRLGTTINKVETATALALTRRRRAPTMGGVAASSPQPSCKVVTGTSIGYVQRVDLAALQALAEEFRLRITVSALPGTFAAPGRALAHVAADTGAVPDLDVDRVTGAFTIANSRTYDEDPRFGLIVLSEIASRALSPAVNDPGTAIDVIGRLVRLFAGWNERLDHEDQNSLAYDRVAVPELSLHDMFDDAFNAIARDGAGTVEVAVRLQKAFESLASLGDAHVRDVAAHHARRALARAETALDFPADQEAVRTSAQFAFAGRA